MRRRVHAAGFALLATMLALTAAPPRAVARPWLGVQLAELSSRQRDSLGLAPGRGVRVVRVIDGGPAERAGLRKDDVVLRFRGKDVGTTHDLIGAIAAAREGDAVAIARLRAGQRRELTATLAPWPTTGEFAPRTDLAGAEFRNTGNGRVARLRFREPDGTERDWVGDPASLDDATLDRALAILETGGEFALGYRAAIVGAQSARVRLGVRTVPLEAEMAARLGAAQAHGALVVAVIPGSRAAAAGLLAGDVIAAVDGREIDSPDALDGHLNPLDTRARLTIWRGAQRRDLEAALAPRPRDPMRAWEAEHDSLMMERLRQGIALRETTYSRAIEQPSDPDWAAKLETLLFADPAAPAHSFGNPDPVPPPGSREDLRRQVEDLRREVADLRRRLDHHRAR